MSASLQFLAPEFWPLLILAPSVFLILWLFHRRRERELTQQIGVRAMAKLVDLRPGVRRLRWGLHAGGVALAAVSAMQPVWWSQEREWEPQPLDLLLCLDVSRSMLARDLAPNRFGHAIAEIRELAQRRRGDRIGLIAFAGEAKLAVPLTNDGEALIELAALSAPEWTERGGSDPGAALELALATLSGRREARAAVIILIGDGEDFRGRGPLAARRCWDQGIPVHVLGLGSEKGSKIPIVRESQEVFLLDREGQEVVSARDSQTLRSIAREGGGEFLEARAASRILGEFGETSLAAMARGVGLSSREIHGSTRSTWPLALAFLFWLLETSWSERRRR